MPCVLWVSIVCSCSLKHGLANLVKRASSDEQAAEREESRSQQTWRKSVASPPGTWSELRLAKVRQAPPPFPHMTTSTPPLLNTCTVGVGARGAPHRASESSSKPQPNDMVAIRRLTPSSAPADVDAAAQLLTTVFADDQLTRIVSGPVPGLHAARMRSTLVTGVLDLDVFAAYEGDDGEGQMLGVLILKPPGVVDRHRCVSARPTTSAGREY